MNVKWKSEQQEKRWMALIKEILDKKIGMEITTRARYVNVKLSSDGEIFHQFSIVKVGEWQERLIKDLSSYRSRYFRLQTQAKVG